MAKTREEFTKEVEAVLDQLREGIRMHGGGVELVDADPGTGVVTVRLQGACVGCPFSDMTLKAGIEETLKEMVEGVTAVEKA